MVIRDEWTIGKRGAGVNPFGIVPGFLGSEEESVR